MSDLPVVELTFQTVAGSPWEGGADLRDAGVQVWFDEWEIQTGDSIVQSIQDGLRVSDFVAVLLTRESVSHGWVEKLFEELERHPLTLEIIQTPVPAPSAAGYTSDSGGFNGCSTFLRVDVALVFDFGWSRRGGRRSVTDSRSARVGDRSGSD